MWFAESSMSCRHLCGSSGVAHGSSGVAHGGQHALIVSTRGARSIMDQIAGSDADGDVFSVVFNEDILRLLPDDRLHPPWTLDQAPWAKQPPRKPPATAAPAELEIDELLTRMHEHLLRCKQGQIRVGQAANAWLAMADKFTALHGEAKQLVYWYMEFLDSGKADHLAELPPSLIKYARPMPVHLKKYKRGETPEPAVASADSSVLLQMYAAVSADQIGAASQLADCPEVYIDPDLAGNGQPKHDERRDKWLRWMDEHEGYIRQLKTSGRYSSERWLESIASYRSELLGGKSPATLVVDPDHEAECQALYDACYRSRAQFPCGRCTKCRQQGEPNRRAYRFVWCVAGDLLLLLKGRAALDKQRKEKPLALQSAPRIADQELFHLAMKPRKRGHAAIAEHRALAEDGPAPQLGEDVDDEDE